MKPKPWTTPGVFWFPRSGWGQEPTFPTSTLKTLHMLAQALSFEHKVKAGWAYLTERHLRGR